jgi:glutathione synthase/RimK-type ligase-like ATP-grasp enzyme
MSNLFETINTSHHDFYFLVVDEFLDIDIPELTNFVSISPQKLGITLDQKNSGRLLAHPATIDFINQNSLKTGRIPAIIPFKPSARIDIICRQQKWLLVGNPSSLNRYLEDKIKFIEICKKINLPAIDSLIKPFTQQNYLLAQQQFGNDLVVQTHFGWAGNSSHLAHKWDDIYDQIPEGTIVKISPYLNGYSLINNCCLTDRGLLQSPPGLQYTGIPTLTTNPLATVGRQWPSFAPPHIQKRIHQLTVDFSQVLLDLKYRGYFGLDFLVSNDQVYILECNPRLTASFAFYNRIEIKNNITPLFLYHLAQFTNSPYQIPTPYDNSVIVGSEITSKNDSGITIKKYHDFIPFVTGLSQIKLDREIISRVL